MCKVMEEIVANRYQPSSNVVFDNNGPLKITYKVQDAFAQKKSVCIIFFDIGKTYSMTVLADTMYCDNFTDSE